MKAANFTIAVGGIIDTNLELELRKRFPDQSVILSPKKDHLEVHYRSCNDSVVHNGIYFQSGLINTRRVMFHLDV